MNKLKELMKVAVILLIVSLAIITIAVSEIKQDLQWQQQHLKYYQERRNYNE